MKARQTIITIKTYFMKTLYSNLKFFGWVLFYLFTSTHVSAQEDSIIQTNALQPDTIFNRINIYVFTKDPVHKVDWFGFTVKLRAGMRSLFHSNKLYVIRAKSGEQIGRKIEEIFEGKNARIGSIWFDSHGAYRRGYSSVNIGKDEFSFKNINDTSATLSLRKIAEYTDEKSRIGIGSCYGGATYLFPGSEQAGPGRMNGDSLMIGMGQIFSGSNVYGSESWVMVKPGMFSDNFAFAGYPLGKRYKKDYWQPVWERLGNWNMYNSEIDAIVPVNTVGLNQKGSITIRMRHYQELSKGKKAVGKSMVKN
jgi:hypothetical protein